MWVSPSDIFAAFDHLGPEVVAKVFEERGVEDDLIAAYLQEGVGLKVEPCFGSIGFDECDFIEFMKSIRQGGKESTSMWNNVIHMCLAKFIPVWRESSFGINLHGLVFTQVV